MHGHVRYKSTFGAAKLRRVPTWRYHPINTAAPSPADGQNKSVAGNSFTFFADCRLSRISTERCDRVLQTEPWPLSGENSCFWAGFFTFCSRASPSSSPAFFSTGTSSPTEPPASIKARPAMSTNSTVRFAFTLKARSVIDEFFF